MNIFQIIALLFALFMLYVVTLHRQRLRMSAGESMFWWSLWLFFIVITLFPELLLGIAGFLHFSRVFDLLIVGAFMILTVIVVLTYFIQRENQKKLEDLVRQDAVKHAK